MNPSDLAKIKVKFPVSKDVEKLSLDTAGVENPNGIHSLPDGKPGRVLKRLRQSSKPLMNKLEAEFFERIRNKYPNFPPVRPQAKTYRLANGLKYTPDFTASLWPVPDEPHAETAWEVKGPWFTDDAVAKLKMFAHEWRDVVVWLVWKDEWGLWQKQRILA